MTASEAARLALTHITAANAHRIALIFFILGLHKFDVVSVHHFSASIFFTFHSNLLMNIFYFLFY
jgi:hypothetical protein